MGYRISTGRALSTTKREGEARVTRGEPAGGDGTRDDGRGLGT